jgi:hypothetical protein
MYDIYKREIKNPSRKSKNGKIENIADSVWLSVFIDGLGKYHDLKYIKQYPLQKLLLEF